MKKIIYFIVLLVLTNMGFSQTGKFKGVIIDSYNKGAVHSIDLFLISNADTIKLVSDYSGEFCFNDLEFGIYDLKTRCISRTQDYLDYDTIINFSKSISNLRIEIPRIGRPASKNKKTDIEFLFRHIPTNTDTYRYIITKDSVKLYQKRLIIAEEPSHPYEIERVDSLNYVYAFNELERANVDSIILSNNLDSVALYETRIFHSSLFWKIKIVRNGNIFEISLPQYHNQGLENLLNYVSDLIPEDKKYYWTR